MNDELYSSDNAGAVAGKELLEVRTLWSSADLKRAEAQNPGAGGRKVGIEDRREIGRLSGEGVEKEKE